MDKKKVKKILVIYVIAFLFVIVIGIATRSMLVTLTLFVSSLFAPLRIIFPGYSRSKKNKILDKQEKPGSNLRE